MTFSFIPSIESSRPGVGEPLTRARFGHGEEMVAAINSVGVDGAVMASWFSAYEYDPSYALEVYNTYTDRFWGGDVGRRDQSRRLIEMTCAELAK